MRVFARKILLVLSVLLVQTSPAHALPRAVQQERDEIFTLLAYSLVWIDSQTSVATSRGYNIAAVLVDKDDSIVFWARNCVNADSDFSAHAEVQAMQGYVHTGRTDRPTGFRLYTTLEPCAQCAGMSMIGGIQRVVFGQTDPISGGIYAALRAAGKTTPTPVPSPTRHRDRLEANFKNHPQRSLAVWLYSHWATRVFEAAYEDLKTRTAVHDENAPVLDQVRRVLAEVEAGPYRRTCRP